MRKTVTLTIMAMALLAGQTAYASAPAAPRVADRVGAVSTQSVKPARQAVPATTNRISNAATTAMQSANPGKPPRPLPRSTFCEKHPRFDFCDTQANN